MEAVPQFVTPSAIGLEDVIPREPFDFAQSLP